ncbi:MAG: hypothetical protein ACOX0E_03455 [Syntrophomonadaceae bacterium]
MSHISQIRFIYTSSNSGQGFCSFVPQLLAGCQKIFILDGPPGAGKSTFIRLLGEYLAKRGYEVEFWVSAEPGKGLDGAYLLQSKTALVNGYLPAGDQGHGAGKIEVINLNDFIESNAWLEKKNEIVQLQNRVKDQKEKATAFLQKALHIQIHQYSGQGYHMDKDQILSLTRNLVEDLTGSQVYEKHFFASAISDEGMVNYIEEISLKCRVRYFLHGPEDGVKSEILKVLAGQLREKNYPVEYFHCGLNPEKLVMIIAGGINAAFIDPGNLELIRKPWDKVIDLGFPGTINETRPFEANIWQAQNWLQEARAANQRIKRIVSPHVDFTGLQKKREEIARIITMS